MHAYLISMSALAHLYFGFSVLIEHAFGVVNGAFAQSTLPE
jgi:hypothetical protein